MPEPGGMRLCSVLDCLLQRAMGQQHRVFDRVDVETRRGETGFARRFDLQEVVKLDRLEGGAQLVETVAVAADDLEVEVELGSRGQREGQFTPRSQRLRLDFAGTPGTTIGFRPARYLTARSL